MENVQLNNSKSWKEFEEGKFCVSKSNISLPPSDRIMELSRKIRGSSGGIAGKKPALAKDFKQKFSLQKRIDTAKPHHL